MGKNRKKQVKYNQKFSIEKKPKIAKALLADISKYCSYSIFDKQGPFKSDRDQKYLVQEIFDSKKSFEIMDNRSGNQGSHSVEVAKLCKEARDRLSELKLDDINSLFSFRLTGKQRIWCQKISGEPMRVLWWDPEHKVYPSQKKHT